MSLITKALPEFQDLMLLYRMTAKWKALIPKDFEIKIFKKRPLFPKKFVKNISFINLISYGVKIYCK